MWLFILVLLLVLVTGGVGLAVEGMRLLLILTAILIIAALVTGRRM